MTLSIPPIYPNGEPLLHHFRAFRGDPLTFWLDVGKSAPVTRVRLGPREFWVVTDAELTAEMLQVKARNYHRADVLTRDDPIMKQHTVFTAKTWDDWLWRRRLLQPAFHRKQLLQFAEGMVAEAQQLVSEWQEGATIGMKAAMKTLTMRVIGRTMFSAPLQQTELLQELFEQISDYSLYRAAALVPLPQWVPTPLYRRTRRAVAQRRELIDGLVAERMQSAEPNGDLLDTLIAANLEDGRQFSPSDIVDEMNSIIFAGHETTAATLTWVFAILAARPDLAQWINEEIVAVLGERMPTLADLKQMPRTEALIKETLRMYPAAYLTLRKAVEADTLGEYVVSAETEFVVNIRGLHMSERYWDEPQTFNPQRFLDGQQPSHKAAFQAFLMGPRKCIGDEFAMMEMQLVIPTILQLCCLTRDEGLPAADISFTMEPEGAVEMKVTRQT